MGEVLLSNLPSVKMTVTSFGSVISSISDH